MLLEKAPLAWGIEMVELRLVDVEEIERAMEMIHSAKKHLKEQGIDQWQTGYPDYHCIYQDIATGKGFFVVHEDMIIGYLLWIMMGSLPMIT